MTPVTAITPVVTVPVLSSTTVSMSREDSSAWYLVMKMPSCAPRPQATINAAGVARPSAHGHAMISTASAALNARSAGAPASSQPASVSPAAARTAGTKTPQIRSASRWIAAFCDWACSTRATRCASWVSRPTLTARTTSRPVITTVPAATVSPSVTSAGTDSPVIMLASTADCPNSTSPSAAIRSPGRTTNRCPSRNCATGTRRSDPSASRTHASRAPAAASSRMASPASRLALASYSRPASRNVVTDAATSR